MQTADNRIRLSIELSSVGLITDGSRHIGHAGFYQQLARWLINTGHFSRSLLESGAAIVAAAEDAHELRQTAHLSELSQVLAKFPIADFQAVGLYYQAQAMLQMGRSEECRSLMASLLDRLPPRFRSKALLSMCAAYVQSNDPASSRLCALEAAKAASCGVTENLRSLVTAQKNLAALRGMEGDNKGALKLLEQSSEAARFLGRWRPFVYLDHLNNTAVELSELGRIAEAQYMIAISLASPLAHWHPHWHETAAEIAAKSASSSRSTVATQNVTYGPQSSEFLKAPKLEDWRPFTESEINGNGSVISLEEWKMRSGLPSRALKLTSSQRLAMTTGDKLVRIMDLLSRDDTDDDKVDRALTAVEDIVLGPPTSPVN